MGALHPKPMFIKLPSTLYRYEKKLKVKTVCLLPVSKNPHLSLRQT